MVDKCIFNCADATRFFGFPYVCPRRMKMWADMLGLDVNMIRKKDKICEHHFDPKHIGKRYLLMDAIPVNRFNGPYELNANPEISSQVENINSDDSTFETIYLTSQTQTLSLKPQLARTSNATIPTNNQSEESNNQTQPAQDSSVNNEHLPDVNMPLLEPVNTAFKDPPKRTYGGHSNYGNVPAKCPKLDITATCYCRCHKGEDENLLLKQKIHEMKAMIAEQSREISLLTSKTKVSEHLLRGKVKKISELLKLESSLRRAIEGLNIRISIMSKRQIKAASNASENSIIIARMICDKRNRYTKSEVIAANKMYAISGRCYYFMRDVLKLNLPHPTTLLRNRHLFSPVPNEHTIYRDIDGDAVEQEHEELLGPIAFSPERLYDEQHEGQLEGEL